MSARKASRKAPPKFNPENYKNKLLGTVVDPLHQLWLLADGEAEREKYGKPIHRVCALDRKLIYAMMEIMVRVVGDVHVEGEPY